MNPGQQDATDWYVNDAASQGWIAECTNAAFDDRAFADFRHGPIMNLMCENRDTIHIPTWWTAACALAPTIAAKLPAFARNDPWGGATTITYEGCTVSGNTIWYALTLAVLENLFGPLDGWHWAEIGAGYGGQPACVLSAYNPKSVTLYDLIAPSCLQKRYLAAIGHNAIWPALGDSDDIPEFDMLHSCCALSELRPEARAAYIPVLQRAKRGYLVWAYFKSAETPEYFSPEELVEWLNAIVPAKVHWCRREENMHPGLWQPHLIESVFYWGADS